MIDRETALKLIAGGGESRNLDFKGPMDWALLANDDKYSLVKDVLAMMNTPGGGRIIIGVEDDTHALRGLTEDAAAGWDPTRFNQFLVQYTDPQCACGVHRFDLDNGWAVIIDVPEFTDIPILCKKDANRMTDGKHVLRKGALYIRNDIAESHGISSVDEMRELLGRGLLRQGDRLLQHIAALIKGTPQIEADVKAAYLAEIETAEEYFNSNGLEHRAHWEFVIMPIPFVPGRMDDLASVQMAVRSAEVALRGWNFPHTDQNPVNARNFVEGFQSLTHRPDSPHGNHLESYRTYRSGLFAWRGDYWGAAQERENALVFTSIVYQVTEFINFAARYCSTVVPDGKVHLIVRMTGTAGRHLVSPPSGMPLLNEDYSCLEPSLELSGDYAVSEIRADPDGVARSYARRIFGMFNWNRPSDNMIRGWQQTLRVVFPGR